LERFSKNDIISLVEHAPRYDLAESYGPNLRLADVMSASDWSGFGELPLAYGTPQGELRLRQAIADLHGVTADEVVVTVGGMHALFLLAFILCDRGDEAVVTAPLFPPARAALDAVGACVRTVNLTFSRGYQLDLDELHEQLSKRTKLVSFASPQNPSGVAIPMKTIAGILALMAEICPQAHLLVDETYREAAYGNAPTSASAVTLGPRIVAVASLSKCHGAPGLRLGWAITRDPALREQLVLGKFNTVASCSPMDEALALKVFEQRDRIVGDRREQLAAGLAMTARWVAENGDLVDWIRPDAGALCCARLKPAVFDDAAVARFYAVLTELDVRVGNGLWFGEEARIFRLGFGLLPLPDFDAALRAVTSALRQAARVAA